MKKMSAEDFCEEGLNKIIKRYELVCTGNNSGTTTISECIESLNKVTQVENYCNSLAAGK